MYGFGIALILTIVFYSLVGLMLCGVVKQPLHRRQLRRHLSAGVPVLLVPHQVCSPLYVAHSCTASAATPTTRRMSTVCLADTLANITAIISTLFLMGPMKQAGAAAGSTCSHVSMLQRAYQCWPVQLKNMMEKGRIFATLIFLVSLVLTLFAALKVSCMSVICMRRSQAGSN